MGKNKYNLHPNDCHILSRAVDDANVLINKDMATIEMSTKEARKMYELRQKDIEDLYERCGCK